MKTRKKYRQNLNVTSVVIFIVLTIYVISVLAMYLWAFFASIKTETQFSQDNVGLPPGWPWEWAWSNYIEALRELKVDVSLPNYHGYVYFSTMFWNSILYTIGGALINNLTIWLVAFLLARYSKYKLSSILFAANIALMTIPVINNLPSALSVYRALNWYDNLWFIVFNNIAFTGMYLIIYYEFIRSLGRDYYEAAYMDGAGRFTIMTKIVFPLTSSMFFVVFLLLAIVRWNDYMTMIIWMPNRPTLVYGVYKTGVSRMSQMSFPPLQIAVCMVIMLPMLLLFFLFQKSIMGNLRLGAVKG